MEIQVPDEGDRAALVEATPALPEGLYDVDVPALSGWEPPSRAYVRLSPAYEAEAQQAVERAWRAEHLDGSHLDVLTRPDVVAAVVVQVLQA